jgi:flagellar export protein FliJ
MWTSPSRKPRSCATSFANPSKTNGRGIKASPNSEIFAAAVRDRDLAAARVTEAIARLEELTRMISGERFPAWVREQGWNALNAQRDLLRTLQNRLAQEEQKVDAKRELLIAADRDHQLVLKLREKWLANIQLEAARAEEKQLEDFVTATRFLQTAIP